MFQILYLKISKILIKIPGTKKYTGPEISKFHLSENDTLVSFIIHDHCVIPAHTPPIRIRDMHRHSNIISIFFMLVIRKLDKCFKYHLSSILQYKYLCDLKFKKIISNLLSMNQII